MGGVWRWGVLLAVMAALLGAGSARADGDAPLFRIGPHDLGLSIGYGHGSSITSTGRIEGKLVREFVVVGVWRIALTREPLEPALYKGVLSLRIEPSLIVNFEPRGGVAGGAAAMLRYELKRWGRIRPYLEGGAGIIGLSFDLADQADGLAFNPTAGVGLVHRLSDRLTLDVACRFQHISNAFTAYPNGGIEAFQYLAGISYRL